MSERMLSAIQAVEKGARPVFPIMPFSAFPEFMDQLKKALERRAHRFTGKLKHWRFYVKAGVFNFYQ